MLAAHSSEQQEAQQCIVAALFSAADGTTVRVDCTFILAAERTEERKQGK
jgi:hypothetical protein